MRHVERRVRNPDRGMRNAERELRGKKARGARSVPPSGMHAQRPRSALRGLRITFSGLLCAGIVVLVGLAALNSEANLLFLLFGISVGVVICSAAGPVFMVRKIEVERTLPAAVIAGRPFAFEYAVRNGRRWFSSWSITIGEVPARVSAAQLPLAFLECIRAGESLRVELTGLCPKRGCVPLRGIRVLSRFPFGLFACMIDLPLPAELIVYPAVGRLRRDLWRDRRPPDAPAQHSSQRQSSEQDEFYGLREYRPGDNLRWVHWRRSAHAGHLVVRENAPVRTQQLTVVLDPWPEPPTNGPKAGPPGKAKEVPGTASPPGRSPTPPKRWKPVKPFALLQRIFFPWRDRNAATPPWTAESVERIISLAATAICDSLERGHRVGLIARGVIPVVIAPSAGRPQRQRLLHELAMLRPGATEGLDLLVSRVRWSGGWNGRCLVCATHANQSHAHVVRHLSLRTESATAITGDAENFEALFEAPSESPANAGAATGPRSAAKRRGT